MATVGVAADSCLQPLDTLGTLLCPATLRQRHPHGLVVATDCPASGAARRAMDISRLLHDAVGRNEAVGRNNFRAGSRIVRGRRGLGVGTEP